MTDAARIADHDRLRAVLSVWDGRWAGRPLHRVDAGPGWVRLHLEGEDRPWLLLSVLAGANLVTSGTGPVAPALKSALRIQRDHPLRGLLAGCSLDRCFAHPTDRIAALVLTAADGRPLALLQQLFGARGNLGLVDGRDRLLWAQHRPPHDLLTRMPAPPDPPAAEPGADPPEHPAGALKQLAWRLAADLGGELETGLRRRLRAAERLVQGLDEDLAGADRAEDHRRLAEALAASLHLVRPGLDLLRTTDPRDGSPLAIPLDPGLAPAANLATLFKKAAKGEKGRRVIAERLEQAQATLAELAASHREVLSLLPATFAEEPDPLARLAALQEWRGANPGILRETGSRRGRTGPEEPARPFRRYRLAGGWEVWLGRSSRENDELTHRASHVRDIWLHARGSAGSHAILRTGGRPQDVPKTVIEQAAALAALHSKGRHSGLVPVVWTERRYVRKPRKGAPGLAVCLQEQSVMVAPGIPPGAEPI